MSPLTPIGRNKSDWSTRSSNPIQVSPPLYKCFQRALSQMDVCKINPQDLVNVSSGMPGYKYGGPSSKKRIVLWRKVNKLNPLNCPLFISFILNFWEVTQSNSGTSGQHSTDRQIKIASEASQLHILQKSYHTAPEPAVKRPHQNCSFQ